MGHRANLAIVDHDGYELFYCHWCAKNLPADIFWGPEFALRFIHQQEPVSKDNWMDEVWAEGGVLVDRSRQLLLVFGGEDLPWMAPLCRLYMQLLAEVWTGWAVQWAHSGIVDLIEYVGGGYEYEDADIPNTKEEDVLRHPEEKDWTDYIGSFIFPDNRLALFPVRDYPLVLGPKLIEIAQHKTGYDHLPLDQWLGKGDFPLGGFHIDATRREVACWGADLNHHDIERYRHVWAGWEVIWLKDNYEYQLEQTRGKLTFPPQPIDQLLVEMEKVLMRDSAFGLRAFLEFIEMTRQRGDNLLVNPDALRDNPQKVALAVRKQIFDDAVSSWKKKQQLSI